MLRPVGSASSASRSSTCTRAVLDTSTTGDAPVTVTVSSRTPTRISTLIVAVKSVGSSMPSRTNVLKPASVNVTRYTPGRRSTIVNWPRSLVVADRTFSIRTGLAASTVTPGSTAPDVSLTVPAIALCAETRSGKTTMQASASTSMDAAGKHLRVMAQLLRLDGQRQRHARRKRREFERRRRMALHSTVG